MINTMEYNGYFASVAFDPEDKIFFGHLAGINDIIGFHGATVSELTRAFHESVDDYLAYCVAEGKKPEKPYSGKMMFRVDPKLHAKAARAAQLKGVSLNQWAEEVLWAAAG